MLIVDAGPPYAAAARRHKHHARAGQLLSGAERPLLVSALVLTEVSYLLSDLIGPHAELAFAHSGAQGELVVEAVGRPQLADLRRRKEAGERRRVRRGHLDGRKPSSYLLDPAVSFVPELPLGDQDPLGRAALRFTGEHAVSGRRLELVALPTAARSACSA